MRKLKHYVLGICDELKDFSVWPSSAVSVQVSGFNPQRGVVIWRHQITRSCDPCSTHHLTDPPLHVPLRSHGAIFLPQLYYDISVSLDLSFHQPCLPMQQEAFFTDAQHSYSSKVQDVFLLFDHHHFMLQYNVEMINIQKRCQLKLIKFNMTTHKQRLT